MRDVSKDTTNEKCQTSCRMIQHERVVRYLSDRATQRHNDGTAVSSRPVISRVCGCAETESFR